MASFLRDGEKSFFVTSPTPLLAGDASVPDDRCLNGLKENLHRFGCCPSSPLVRAVAHHEGFLPCAQHFSETKPTPGMVAPASNKREKNHPGLDCSAVASEARQATSIGIIQAHSADFLQSLTDLPPKPIPLEKFQ